MNVFALLSLVALVYVLLWGVVYMLGARKRSWIMAVVRIGITVVSAVISIPLSKVLASVGADLGYAYLLSQMGDELGEFFDKVPAGAEGLRMIAALVVAPILFIVVFLVVRWVVAMVLWIVEKCVPVLKKRSALYMTMPLGALNGILIGIVTLIPLCGFIAFGAELLYTVEDSNILENATVQKMLPKDFPLEEEDVEDWADTLDGQILFTTIHRTVGKPVFNALTTAKLDASATHGESVKINLEKELCGLVTTVGHVAEAADTFRKDDYTARDKEALFDVADSMFESDWVALLMTDTLAAMSESWLNRETFMGIKRPSLDATLNPTVNCVLEVLSEEEPENLEEDLHIILDVVGDLMVHDILVDSMDYNTLVQRLGKDGLLTNLLGKLDESPRLHVLSVELKNLSIRLVTNMLGTDLLKDGRYDDLMDDVAASLTDVLDLPDDERDAVIIEAIQNNFRAEGYDVPDDVALEMSNKMLDELGEDGVITSAELKEYMLTHADEGFDITDDVLPDGEN